MKKQGLSDGWCPPVFGKISRGAALPNAPSSVEPSTAHGARSAAATELRRSRCCDGAAQTSSVALILRVASRRDALNEEPASFSPVLTVDLNFNGRGPQPRPPPWPRNQL